MKPSPSPLEKPSKPSMPSAKGPYVMTLVTKSMIKEGYPYQDGHYPYYDWSIHFQPKDKRWPSLVSIIDKIVVTLHPSFTPMKRILTEPPYRIMEKGWGEFEMAIKILFKDKSMEPLSMSHELHFLPSEEVDIILPITLPLMDEHASSVSSNLNPSSSTTLSSSKAAAGLLSTTMETNAKSSSQRRLSQTRPLIRKEEPHHVPEPSKPSSQSQMSDAAFERLAQRLCSLDASLTKEVAKTVQSFKTEGICSSDGFFSFDLYSLSDEQVRQLSALVHFKP